MKADTERVKFWRDPDLDQLELLDATFITQAFAPHVHERFAIGVIQKGVLGTSYRHKHYAIPAGTVTVINPGELHTGEAVNKGGWTYRMFYPKASQLQEIATDLAGHSHDVPFFPSPIIYDDFLADLLLKTHAILSDTESAVIKRESLFNWVMLQLILRHADDSPVADEIKTDRHYVETVQAYIQGHYADPLTLKHLAAQVGLTPCYMLRMFTKTIGMPPHTYLTQVRVKAAKRLLAQGVPIADVAMQTGFTDQSHLTKRFKRMYGITPGQYVISCDN